MLECEDTRNAQGLSFLSSDLIHVAAFDGPLLANAFNWSDKAAVATYLKQQLKSSNDYFLKTEAKFKKHVVFLGFFNPKAPSVSSHITSIEKVLKIKF